LSAIYDKRTFRSGESVGAHIGRVRKALIEMLDRELAALDLTTAQSSVIVMLAEDLAATASDMCRGLSHDPGAMTRLLDKLESKGLVRRVWTEDDRRSARLELTTKGRALCPRIAEAKVNVFNHMLDGFSRSEVAALEGFLKRMLANAS
jgi:MarR family multiple antibiotic resistance transcriptional regulator